MRMLVVRSLSNTYTFRLDDAIWPHYSYKVERYSGNISLEVTRHVKKGVIEEAAFFTGTWGYTLEGEK